jgi:hypothetical protein
VGSGNSGRKKKKSAQSVGFQFNAPVTANTSTFINGNVNNLNINQGLSMGDLRQLGELFQPFREQVQQTVTLDKQGEMDEKVQALHTELSQGKNANADRLNQIVDGLVEMAPGAVGAVVTMFANPILGALIGPATKVVLDHIKK